MRAKSEKKDKVTSVRMTDEHYDIIQEKAEHRGNSMGSFMVNAALHADNILHPEHLYGFRILSIPLLGWYGSMYPKKRHQFKRRQMTYGRC